MSHYYINDSKLNHQIKSYETSVNHISFTFYTDRGVFSRDNLDFGSRVLLETIQLDQSVKTIIDMGCGYGPIGLCIAKMYPDKHVYLFDINERAIDLAQKNQKENQISNVNIEISNLFDNVKINSDVIVTNPPIRAGKQTVFKLYDDAYKHLNVGGVLYVVIQKKQGAPSSVTHLKDIFHNCEVIEKKNGYWILFAQK
ncbi:MAG: class I SAM-dependent methyltransferase [Acholeplasmataceae bacterium]|nr:class I SAM-dependent methyltransferase [Acholeplasmataceae bacterium]